MLIVICPSCLTANRVPDTRLDDGPTCGKCKARLLDPEPLELDDASFSAFLAKEQLPLVVDFWAAWCGPCRQMAPAFAQAALIEGKRARFAKLDTEACPQAAARHGIRSLPTLVLFSDGKEQDRCMGVMSAQQITGWIKSITRSYS